MAIYHASMKVIGRSSGYSSVAAAAYRAGSKLHDLRRGVDHDYSRKSGVDDSYIIAPNDAPKWVSNRERLWNAVEAVEKRKDSQLCRELVVALPIELDKQAQKSLVFSFANKIFVEQGMVADIALHDLKSHNPHAHILLTMRRFEDGEFGKKERAWNDKSLIVKWRKDWANWTNKALMQAGSMERIDERSYAERGIKKVATKHLGKTASAMEKKGKETRTGLWNRRVISANNSFAQLRSKITKVVRFKNIRSPTVHFNDWAKQMYSLLRVSPKLESRSLFDWLGAGYWLMMRKKIEKKLLREEELRLSSIWVESYSSFVELKGSNLEKELSYLKSALRKTGFEYRIKKEFRSSSGYSPAGTIVSVDCKEIHLVEVQKLLSDSRARQKKEIKDDDAQSVSKRRL